MQEAVFYTNDRSLGGEIESDGMPTRLRPQPTNSTKSLKGGNGSGFGAMGYGPGTRNPNVS